MDIVVDQLNPNTRCLRLSGRLDLAGSNEIDQRFTSLTATHGNPVIIDLSGVDFMASIGIRLLISCAKANAQRGGRMFLSSPQPMVRQVLETAGIHQLIPIYADETEAVNALQG